MKNGWFDVQCICSEVNYFLDFQTGSLCSALSLAARNIMRRGTNRYPYPKDDKSSSSAFCGKIETKTCPERRHLAQHPHSRPTSVGLLPIFTQSVFSPFAQYPVVFYPHVQQIMSGVSRAGIGANLNQRSDPHVVGIMPNRISSTTSEHEQHFQNSSGKRKTHIEQGRDYKIRSCGENINDKQTADCPLLGTSQTERRGSEFNLSRQPHSSREVQGGGSLGSTVQQRNPEQVESYSHYIPRGQLEFRTEKSNLIHKASEKELAYGSDGPIEKQDNPDWRGKGATNIFERNSAENKSGRFIPRSTQGDMGSVESHYGISSYEPGLDKRSPSQRKAYGFGRGTVVVQESQSRVQQREMISVGSNYGISYREPGSDWRNASQRILAGFGERTAVIQESPYRVQDNSSREMRTIDSVKQLSSHAYTSHEKTEKVNVETRFSENPSLTAQKQVMSLNADFSSTPADDISPHTEPDVAPTEPCFQSQQELGRRWSYFQRANHRDGFAFTVVSYNVLADQLLKNNCDLYAGYPRWLLDWEYRKKNLLKEILDFRADVSTFFVLEIFCILNM